MTDDMERSESNMEQSGGGDENQAPQPSEPAQGQSSGGEKKKKLSGLQIFAIILIIIGAVLFVVSWRAEAILTTVVEKAGTKTLGVNVALDSTTLKMFAGSVEMKGLVVDNPEGYQNETLLEAGKIHVDADLSTLIKGDTFVMEKVHLDEITVTLEQKGLTSNIDQVVKNAKSQMPESKPGDQPADTEKVPGKKVQVSELTLTNIKVRAKFFPTPGTADTVEFTLSPIEMKDLGKNKAMDAAELTAKVMMAIAMGIIENAPAKLPGQLLNSSRQILDVGKTLGTDTLDKTKDVGKGVLEKTGEGAGKLIEGIFGGSKEEE